MLKSLQDNLNVSFSKMIRNLSVCNNKNNHWDVKVPEVAEPPVDVQKDIAHNFGSQTPRVALLPSLFKSANKIYHVYQLRCTLQYSKAKVH